MSKPATPVSHPAIRIQLIGTPTLFVASGEPHVLERRDAALLALLAIDGKAPRVRAATLLWPEADEDHARNNLRQRMFRLHRRAGRTVVAGDATLALTEDVTHDLVAIGHRLAEYSGAAAGDLLGALNYEDSLELAEWINAAREKWRLACRSALAELASQMEAAGQIARAMPYVERLIAEDPLAEHAHRRLMRLHYLRGDRGAALAAYARCRVLLDRELNAAPGKETLELAALIESSGVLPTPAPAPLSVTVLRPPRIVGRAAELAELAAAWNAQQVMVVRGEPGIGKTRLLTAFAATQTGVRLDAARPGDGRVPYATLARLLRGLIQTHGRPTLLWVVEEFSRLLPELGAVQSRKLEPVRLAQATSEALAGWHAAGLSAVCLDDLHYADEASLEALFIAIGARSVRWMLGVRANEIPVRFAEWLARTESESCVIIALGPLSTAAIGELLHSLAIPGLDPREWTEPLARHTGGNPMFILETLRASLRDGGQALRMGPAKLPAPANIGQLIERRLAQLSPPALKLARIAAIAGQDFTAELAAAVLQQHALDMAEAWRELESAQVIRDNAFAHDLILEAMHMSVPRAIAKVLHKAIGAYLESAAAPAARVAYHWVEAGEWRMAALQFNAAARAAFDASRYPEAGALFRRAAECFGMAGTKAEQHIALQELAGCQIKAFDLTGAREVAEQLRSIAVDEAQAGWALDRLIDTLNMSRQDDSAAQAAAVEMQRRGHATGNPWMVFNAKRKLAIAFAHQGRFDQALTQFDSQTEWIERNLHEWNVHVWWCDHAYVLDLADRRDLAIAAYRHAETLARQHENWAVVYASLRNLALTQAWAGRLRDALETSDEAVRFSGRLGDALVLGNPRDAARRAALLRDAGRLGEALTLLRAAHADLLRGSSPYWLAYCVDQLALIFAQLGQPARIRDSLAHELPPLPPEAEVTRWISRSVVSRANGHGTVAWSARVVEAAIDPKCPARWRLLAALERAVDIDPSEALSVCSQVALEAKQRELTGIHLHALARAAGRAADAGENKVAVEFARGTLSLASECSPAGMPASEMFWNVYRGFVAVDDAGAAARALQRAVEWIEQAALPYVPDEYCDSFLNRNPINRAILTTASRRAR